MPRSNRLDASDGSPCRRIARDTVAESREDSDAPGSGTSPAEDPEIQALLKEQLKKDPNWY